MDSPTGSMVADIDEDKDRDEFFACQLTTEKFRSHMNAIIYTHPWRVARWAWDEQGADGTDGWMARLKTICIVEPRKVSAGRELLMEMADNPKKTMPVPLYHLLVCVHLICLELPVPTNGIMTHMAVRPFPGTSFVRWLPCHNGSRRAWQARGDYLVRGHLCRRAPSLELGRCSYL